MEAKLLLQGGHRLVAPGEHHDPRGVAVQSMHHQDESALAGTAMQLAGSAGQERVALVVARGVDEQPGRLDHHQKVLVEVEDLQAGGVRWAAAARQVGVVHHEVAGTHQGPWLDDHLAVDGDVPVLYLALGVGIRAAEAGLHDAGQPLQRRDLRHGLRVPPVGRPRGATLTTMSETTADRDVHLLLQRGVQAGLSVGCVGLATRGSSQGRVWSCGRAAVGGPPVHPSLIYDLASLTKPLVTTTLLLLARRDGLEFDALLGELVPELEGSPWASVAVWQAASHCGGFPAWEPLYALGDCSREGYLEALCRVQPIGPPGTKVEYSCLGFIALGIALERAGGADLATLFEELVAVPLGIEDELLFAPDKSVAVAGQAWREDAEEEMVRQRGLAAEVPPLPAGRHAGDDGNSRGLGGVAGNAGLFGSAAAVARVAAEYLPGGGELLTGEEVELATKCRTEGLEQARGLGWQLAATPGCSAGPALPAHAWGHSGFAGTSVWIDPDLRQVYVLLANRLHPWCRTPDLHPWRRRFHALAARVLRGREGLTSMGDV